MIKKMMTAAGALMLLSSAAMAASPNMAQGLWKITTSMEIPGMPYPMKPMSVTTCIHKKDLQDAGKTLPQAQRQNKDCKMKDRKVTGDHVSFKIVCTGKHPATSTADMTYHGTSYEGTMTTVFDQNGAKRTMTYHYKGERIGDCK